MKVGCAWVVFIEILKGDHIKWVRMGGLYRDSKRYSYNSIKALGLLIKVN